MVYLTRPFANSATELFANQRPSQQQRITAALDESIELTPHFLTVVTNITKIRELNIGF